MSTTLQETPLTSPITTIDNWSENFCLSSFDSTSGIGLWLHIGRWRHNLNWWREMFVLMLPDGTVCAHRAIGDQLATRDGPGGPSLAVRVEEAARRLRYQFTGGARRLRGTELREGLLRDGHREALTFDLTFESELPIWDLQKVGDKQEFLGRGHVEQLGKLTGHIRLGDREIKYAGMANRDHSMGPRDTAAVSAHHWMQGQFDNGTGFLIYDAVLRNQSCPIFSEAVVYDGDKMYDASVDLAYRIDDPANAHLPFSLKLTYERGELNILVDKIVNTSYLSYSAPNDMWLGVVQSSSGQPLTLLEQSAIYTLDGHIPGRGHIERTVPGIISVDS